MENTRQYKIQIICFKHFYASCKKKKSNNFIYNKDNKWDKFNCVWGDE